MNDPSCRLLVIARDGVWKNSDGEASREVVWV